jgi:hypothetical protein
MEITMERLRVRVTMDVLFVTEDDKNVAPLHRLQDIIRETKDRITYTAPAFSSKCESTKITVID